MNLYGKGRLSPEVKLVQDQLRRDKEIRARELEGNVNLPLGEKSFLSILFHPSSYLETALLIWFWGEHLGKIRTCECGAPFIQNLRRKPKKYCCNACKSRLLRKSKAE